MHLTITGASGFIGRHLVPAFRAEGIALLLITRDASVFEGAFAGDDGVEILTYEAWTARPPASDALVHLAARNNDRHGTIEKFRAANVAVLDGLLDVARMAGIGVFVNVTTLQALNPGADNAYALSKAEAERRLACETDMRVVTLRLPAVYGETYRGQLSILNPLPGPLRTLGRNVLSCFRPVVHVSQVGKAILRHVRATDGSDHDAEIISDGQQSNPIYVWIMRLVDLAFALVIVGLLWWLLIGIWLAVRMTSPGPGIFSQQRIGKHGQPFTCYKFRTMFQGTSEKGTHEIGAASVSRIGGILRKTKIDELPQIMNILFNQISLVGPRPCLLVQDTLIEERRKRGVFDIKGGITGWSQINDIDMSDPHRLARMDADYVALRTVLFDLKIIIDTVLGRGQGDRVSGKGEA